MTVREIPSIAAADERAQIRWILEECKTVAVVGLSSNPYKDSYIVAHHLHRHGYDLVPINPNADTILGRPVFPSLSALPAADAMRVQLVLIFRPSDEVPQIVDAALAHLPNLPPGDLDAKGYCERTRRNPSPGCGADRGFGSVHPHPTPIHKIWPRRVRAPAFSCGDT